ncbi:sugar phosphate isomerase/epimerase family protein [Pseudozobellia thermophila]|uniref:Inosose dehydratase n=1 Tax=Pseudozobellia thermophila TaxID=192903 RepID=A0A1M6FYM3_9FLAO|nr:TIM barrel protein [Pseudozobellia thermophila]SHJ02858.1 inosose dehydratase [Pseudozobellia thermophila]
MKKIRIGCETYTWAMSGDAYKDKLEHILGVMSRSGFKSIEPDTGFMNGFTDPRVFKEALERNQMELSVLCHVEDWRNPKETDAERKNADQWIEFMKHFPEAILLLVQMPGADRENLKERQQNLLSCVNAIATRAADQGIVCSYHPNSPMGSIYRTEEDYKILLNGLDSRVIKYTPDVGHMAKGGMDPLKVIKEYRDIVNCVHYKDMYEDGRWAQMGKGIIDFEGITRYLKESDFEGWIIVEDECDEAITDPDGVTEKDGVYIDEVLRPLL